MTNPGTAKATLQITTPSDREIAMTRVFDAPRRLVFDAFTKPELVKQWLLGPPGWTMPVCEITCEWEASIATCGGVRVTEKKWEWAASTGRSCCKSGSSAPSCSTRPGTQVSR